MNTINTLKAAREHLVKYGKIRGTFVKRITNRPVDQCPTCLMGAVQLVIYGQPDTFGMRTAAVVHELCITLGNTWNDVGVIYVYSDRHSKQQVLRLIDKTIARLEAQ